MKKIYSYTLLSLLSLLFTLNTNATIWQVQVNDNSFSPNTLPNVQCGDTVGWILNSILPHNTVSTTIPSGATPWSAPINSSTPVFAYFVPNFAGTYNYSCTVHGFNASFTVSCTAGINDPGQAIKSAVYPNPFVSSVTIVNHQADAARITDMTGRVVKTISLNTSNDKAEINLDVLVPGIYFLTTLKEGVIRETKRIVKAK